jgi:hypothetical protein
MMNSTSEPRKVSWSRTIGTLVGDVVIPLVVFYGLRALEVNAWLALVLGAIAPVVTIIITLIRERRLDPLGVFIIAAMALSIVIALFTGDPRTLLARESWLTGFFGLWIIITMFFTRPFLLDAIIKLSTPVMAGKLETLWTDVNVFQRWLKRANIFWGCAFLIDAVARVIMAYTLPVDAVPVLGVLVLIAAIVIAQTLVMIDAKQTGALRLLRSRKRI